MQPDQHKVPGMLTVDQLRTAVEDGSIDTVILALPDPYGKLMGKRLDASYFLTDVARGTHACDYLFTVDMEMEPVPGYQFSNWESGYGDVHLVPDLATLRRLSWHDRTALVLCDAQLDPNHEPVTVAPRSILRKQLERLRAQEFEAMAGSELEYFLYRTSYLDAARNNYRDLAEVGWYREDYTLLQMSRTEDLNGAFRRHLAASGVPVESTKGEFGKNQHELNIRYAPILEMADRHLLLKQAVKEISDRLGCSATFMAKPYAGEAGSSSHLHVSLWTSVDGDPTNAFPGSADLSGIACSDIFRWFLGGWMHYVPELMVCFAPTVNSYKRFEAGSWAPTALAWSPDNRTAGFRIVGSGPSPAHRMPHRRRRHQPIPRLRRRHRLRPRRHRATHRAPARTHRRRLRRRRPPNAARHPRRSRHQLRSQRPRSHRLRRRRSRTLRALPHHRSPSLPQRRHRLGTNPLL